MLKTLIFFLLNIGFIFFLGYTSLNAQSDTLSNQQFDIVKFITTVRDENAPRIGAKAFQFGINGLNLSGILAGKYWTSENTAWSVGLGIYGRGANPSSQNQYATNQNRNDSGLVETTIQTFQIGLSAAYQYHFVPNATLSPYVGLSSGISYANSSGKLVNPTVLHQSMYINGNRYVVAPCPGIITANENVFGISAAGTLGVEYFITKRISFTGQFSFGIYLNYSDFQSNESDLENSEKSKKAKFSKEISYSLSNAVTSLLLSIYF